MGRGVPSERSLFHVFRQKVSRPEEGEEGGGDRRQHGAQNSVTNGNKFDAHRLPPTSRMQTSGIGARCMVRGTLSALPICASRRHHNHTLTH
jgi:hypothetical protein